MIEFHRVSLRYPTGFTALQDINLRIAQGELAFLTGHSGAGKSSLLKLIALMERASAGRIQVHGRALEELTRKHIPALRREMGLIFQDFRLLNDRTVFDNVALPLVISGHYDDVEIARRVRAALDKVGLLGKEHCYPVALSGGEQQRVGIARAVVNRPKVLLADEPTGNLDPVLSQEIMALFDQFSRVGVTVVIASHDLDLIERMGHRTLTLREGRLVGDRPRAPQ